MKDEYEENDWMNDLLHKAYASAEEVDATMPAHVDDAGFADTVMEQLPPKRRHRKHVRFILLSGALWVGLCLTALVLPLREVLYAVHAQFLWLLGIGATLSPLMSMALLCGSAFTAVAAAVWTLHAKA